MIRPRRYHSKTAKRTRTRLNDTPTPAEAALARALTDLGIHHTQNYIVKTPESTSGYYVVDFHLPHHKLFIELDGQPHTTLQQQWNDKLRTEAILTQKPNHTLIRAWNKDILKDPHTWITTHTSKLNYHRKAEHISTSVEPVAISSGPRPWKPGPSTPGN